MAYVVGGAQEAGPRLTPEQLQDLALMAEQDGMTRAQAIDSFTWREPFSELVNGIRAAYPDAFAGSGVTRGPDGAPWIAFRAAAPADAINVCEGFSERVTVIEGKGFTERQLADLVTDVHYRIYESPYAEKVWSGYDLVTGNIDVSLVPADKTASRDWVHDQLMALLAPWQERVVLRIVDDIDSGDTAVYGGGPLSRDTAAVSFANPGVRVCRFSQTTGAKCDYVLRLNQCLQGRCRLTQTDLLQSDFGDSGGLWSYGGDGLRYP